MGASLAAVIGAVIAAHALSIEPTYDIGLAYRGGQVAWETGRPESLHTWISTPFLAMVLAVASRVASEQVVAEIVTYLNIALLWLTIAATWWRLRERLPGPLWAGSLVAAASFAPAASSLWWKQLNVVAFVLAVASFAAARAGRSGVAGLLGALSIAVKPIVVLLPLVLLIGKETRRAAMWMIGWGLGLLAASQAFLAIRAGSLGALSPLPAIENFSDKALPQNIWVCHAENFSPQSMLCRLAGSQHWTLQRLVVMGGVALVGLLLLDAIWKIESRGWEWFAAACLLSPMVSPIAWSHYQLLLAPTFVVLLVRFVDRRERVITWVWIGVSYVLAQLVWQPAGSAPGALRRLAGGAIETSEELFGVFAVAMFAQYALLLTALLHYRRAQTWPSPVELVELHEEPERTQVW